MISSSLKHMSWGNGGMRKHHTSSYYTRLKQLFNPLLLMQKRIREGVRIKERRRRGSDKLLEHGCLRVCNEERGHKTETVKVILIPGYTSLCSATNEWNRKHICGSLFCLLHHHYHYNNFTITIHLNLKCTTTLLIPPLLLLGWSKLHEKILLLLYYQKRENLQAFLHCIECFTTNNLAFFCMECVL